MPIVDGKYEAQIMTYYKGVDEAMDDVRDKLKRTRKVRVSNIPVPLLKELLPLLKDKDLSIILPEKAKAWPELLELCPVAQQRSKIFVDYKGTEALAGNLVLPDVQFSVLWDAKSDKVLEITAMNYASCVKCQRKIFDMGWRYSEKLKKGK
jgi:hypothetical protein